MQEAKTFYWAKSCDRVYGALRGNRTGWHVNHQQLWDNITSEGAFMEKQAIFSLPRVFKSSWSTLQL